MRRRLVAITLASTTMITLAFVLPLAVLVRDVAEERALLRGRQVATAMAPTLLTGDRDALEVALSGLDPALDVSVVLPDGDVLGARVPSSVDLEPARQGAAYTVGTSTSDVLVTPVIRPAVGTSIIVVEVPLELQHRGVAAAWAVLALLALLLVSGAVLLSDRLGRSVTRPAAAVTRTARRLAAGDLDARAPTDGPSEVADIAEALNGLAERIDGMLVREREAVADLSHRLRTPMTALRLDVESVEDTSARERLTADLDALERSVDRLIRDARAGAAAATTGSSEETAAGGEVTDVVPIVRQRAGWWAALADDQGRRTLLDVAVDRARVRAGRTDLVDALDSVLGNVFAHTPEGTSYRVDVNADDGSVVIAVTDRGPGIDPGVGTRRGTSGAGSTGLGLDIARRTAERSGGQLVIDAADPGARVSLVLPVVGPEAPPERPDETAENRR